ncbi:MAG: four helix bundle protein [Bacteroidia bacterium]
MHNLKELKIWNKAIDLTVEIYKATENFPKQEMYGSSYEVQTQLVISNRLKLIDDEALKPLLKEIDEIQKMNYKSQMSIVK